MIDVADHLYDDPEFLAGYRTLPRSIDGLDGAPEWPNVRALVPDLEGKSVVDLGCGFGWFSRWAADNGAARVVGIDVSEAMLDEARQHDRTNIEYRQADLEDAPLEPAAFDLAYSALALHYVERLPRLIRRIRDALRPGGTFVATVEHPIFSAPSRPSFADTDHGRVWPLDGYLREGPRTTEWFVDGVVKQHRTVGSYVRAILDAGLTLTHLEEWGPTDAQLEAHPEWAGERDRPPFLILVAGRGRREGTSRPSPPSGAR